ncbi:PLP-dependent transferase [Paramicrosporidium saccamoebae]|uniref:PLP-dependent transferase n=1 Tax=Paramicrosporidium saccamoebae TaxID=1246581 RepID=A0A2H9TIU0_9FUNG|nr:PLP-dependent transferase [Paramicrosporidium saccamoebae]
MARAERIVHSIGSVGAYSHSQGILAVRETIAKYIERRDGVPAQPNSIFLTNGASDAVTRVLECIITDKNIGVMIPIPQYPLYSALTSLLNGSSVPYYLDEAGDWSLKMAELERAINEARLKNVDVRAICIINPGNPTGNCFSRDAMRDIVTFCKQNRLILLADEVYQMNVYGERPFVSARQVAFEMDADIEVISFNSISKGLVGECGHRGGYYECYNLDPFVIEQFYKQASICLCSNVPGQILMSLMVDPPRAGEQSYERWRDETAEIWASLKRRAEKLQSALVSMTDVTCNVAAGAMYLFPKISFPERLMEHARLLDKQPDEVYAMELLNATGIVNIFEVLIL